MSDSIAGEVAFIEGTEFVNNARTTNYLRAGFGPDSLQVHGDCGCSAASVIALIDCDETDYVSPILDPAPWYDPTFPESANFAGFLMTKFEGMGSTYTREVFPVIDGGGILGRLRAQPRTLKWSGFLFGKTCCGVGYGLRWLTSMLAQSRCGAECTGETLDIMICCPETVAACNTSGEPDPFTSNEAFRTLFHAGLMEGPIVKSERRSSCCGASVFMEVEFSIVVGNPYLYKQPIVIAQDASLFTEIDCADVFIVSEVPCPDVIPCPTSEPCTVDLGCPSPALPVIPQFITPCACDPIFAIPYCQPIAASSFNAAFSAEPVFQIYAGSTPIRNTAIKLYPNPRGLTCDEITADPCNACSTIRIRYIPAFATLTIDSVNRRITIECKGGEVQPGEPYLVGGFTWPVLDCIDYCVCIEVDGFYAASDATYSISIYPKEM